MFNYISDKLFDMKMDWIAADNKERAIKVVKAAADVAMLATGAGQVAKTAKTASKLAQCGKGAKMVATFTANAQKSNMIKAGTKIAEAAAVKAAATTVENMNNKTTSNTSNNYTGTSIYTGRWSAGFEVSKETECRERVRVKVRLGHWSRQEAIEYVKRELYSHYMAPLSDINATMFVDEALK
jgi:hypothetical protein